MNDTSLERWNVDTFERSNALDLSIIIVNWNTRDLLADCLQSVYDTVHDLTFELFVVDNASNDESAAMVRERFPQVRLIENSENVGFARANNQAIVQSRGESILLLNPDAVLHADSVDHLYVVLHNYPKLGIVGAQLLNSDGTDQESWGWYPSVTREIPFIRRIVNAKCAADEPGPVNAYHQVDWVSGACFLIRRDVVESIGLLDENYWLYTEETDWCYRATKRGWKVGLVPEACVTHLRRAASRQKATETMLWYYRSRVLFVAKHQGSIAALLYRFVLALKALLWWTTPSDSPLRRAYADIDVVTVRRSYVQLVRQLLA
jgi:hypothetical protein